MFSRNSPMSLDVVLDRRSTTDRQAVGEPITERLNSMGYEVPVADLVEFGRPWHGPMDSISADKKQYTLARIFAFPASCSALLRFVAFFERVVAKLCRFVATKENGGLPDRSQRVAT